MPPVTSGEVPFLRWGLEMPKEESWSRAGRDTVYAPFTLEFCKKPTAPWLCAWPQGLSWEGGFAAA